MNTLFLDVDGVINCFSDRPPRSNTQWPGEWGREVIDGFWVLWSHSLVVELSRLSERDDLTIVWHTDWQDKALVLGERIGLPKFEVIRASQEEIETRDPWWKLVHVQEAWRGDPDAKIIWLDDSTIYDPRSHMWGLGRDRLLTISPNFNHGLSRKHIEMVNEFLDS